MEKFKGNGDTGQGAPNKDFGGSEKMAKDMGGGERRKNHTVCGGRTMVLEQHPEPSGG